MLADTRLGLASSGDLSLLQFILRSKVHPLAAPLPHRHVVSYQAVRIKF